MSTQRVTEILEIKAAVRERDGNRCTRCGITNEEAKRQFKKSLAVHRNISGSEYTVDGCKTFCFACHATGHEEQRSATRLPPHPVTAKLSDEELSYLRKLAAHLERIGTSRKPTTPGHALHWILRSHILANPIEDNTDA